MKRINLIITTSLLLLFAIACKKKNDAVPVIPTVTTTQVSAVTSVSASSGGAISSDGGSAVTTRGVCWSTSQNPTITNSKTTDGSGTGTFTSSITG